MAMEKFNLLVRPHATEQTLGHAFRRIPAGQCHAAVWGHGSLRANLIRILLRKRGPPALVI